MGRRTDETRASGARDARAPPAPRTDGYARAPQGRAGRSDATAPRDGGPPPRRSRHDRPGAADAPPPRRQVYEAPRELRPRKPRDAAPAADRPLPPPPKKKGEKLKFDVTCVTCGAAAQVPFKPIEGRDIFCQPCYRARPRTDVPGEVPVGPVTEPTIDTAD